MVQPTDGPGRLPIRVVIVDDHEVVRVGLTSLFTSVPDIQVVGEAATAADARQVVERTAPDVLTLDVRLPDGSGIDVCRDVAGAYPHLRILILTSYPDEEALFAAIMAGAAGYLLKEVAGRELVAAIRRIHSGASLLDPAVTGPVLQRLRDLGSGQQAGDPGAALTDLDRRILDLLVDGKTNREISRLVFLSDGTVKHYVSGILHKLQVARRSEAAATWVRTHGRPFLSP